MGGFEAACHINEAGHRLDMPSATQHDRFVAEDFAALRSLHIRFGSPPSGRESRAAVDAIHAVDATPGSSRSSRSFTPLRRRGNPTSMGVLPHKTRASGRRWR